MKKKIAAPKKSVKSVKRTAPQKRRSQQDSVITVQRIVIFSACVVIALVGAVFTNKPAITQTVAGASVAKGLFAQTTIDLPEVDGAIFYNIYYKKAGDAVYTHAVRNISVNEDSYTISHLTKGADYEHKIVAVDASGKEFWFTPTRPLLNLVGM